jgi:tetratricopeptide (TPR) repeat protein
MGTAKLMASQPELAWDQYLRVAIAGREAWSYGPSHVRYYKKGLRRCYERVARAREARGEVEEALAVRRKAVQLLQGEIEPRVRLVEAYERAGRRDEAIRELGTIRELDPDRPGLQEWLMRLKAGERQ